MKLWTKSFIIGALENAITTGLSAFAGSLVLTTTPTAKDVIAAGVGAGVAVLYSFSKTLGAVQSANGTAAQQVAAGK